MKISPNGKYLAFGECYSGNDVADIHFLDIETQRVLDDTIENVPAALMERIFVTEGFGWAYDSKYCYYTKNSEIGLPKYVYRHEINTDSAEGSLFY